MTAADLGDEGDADGGEDRSEFNMYDKDGDGEITREELKMYISSKDEYASLDDVQVRFLHFQSRAHFIYGMRCLMERLCYFNAFSALN